MSATVLHLMGPTCAGKSTIIRRLVEIEPKRVAAVEVGRMLRAKYGEAYFKGQAAPAHTQNEAWQMYVDGSKKAIAAGARLILVDGQPRDTGQARQMDGLWKHPSRAAFVLIHAEHDERERRARSARKPGPDLDLAIARLTNDYRNCYTVMAELLRRNEVIRVFDTTKMESADALCEQIIAEYMA